MLIPGNLGGGGLFRGRRHRGPLPTDEPEYLGKGAPPNATSVPQISTFLEGERLFFVVPGRCQYGPSQAGPLYGGTIVVRLAKRCQSSDSLSTRVKCFIVVAVCAGKSLLYAAKGVA